MHRVREISFGKFIVEYKFLFFFWRKRNDIIWESLTAANVARDYYDEQNY